MRIYNPSNSPLCRLVVNTPLPQVILTLLVCLVFLPAIPKSHASIAGELSDSEINSLDTGETIIRQKESTPWPTIIVYRKINAPPQDVIRLFSDYEQAPVFAKSLTSAIILGSSPDGSEKIVQYNAKIPLLPNISYVVRNKASSLPLRVTWERVESFLFSKIRGELLVEADGLSSLIRYTSEIQPASKLAFPLGVAVSRQARNIMESFSEEVEKRALSD